MAMSTMGWWLRHRLLGDPVQASKDVYWWFMHRTFRKYHIVYLKHLCPGYHGADTRIVHAMFTILGEFMVSGRCKEVDWDVTPEVKHVWEELQDLNRWWNEEYLKRREPILDVPDEDVPPLSNLDKSQEIYPVWHEACQQTFELEKRWYIEDKEQMRRLVEVYRYM